MYDYEQSRVLIAEDDYLACAQIREIVEMVGHTVVGEAGDGYEAVEMTATLHPDVVLMDIKMPGIDGLEATRRIQKICPTPVVVLTAYQSPELVERANGAGVGAYLVKPSNARILERTLAIARARFHDIQQLRMLTEQLQDEIVNRKRIEHQLRSALQEKDILLKEIHHRVKNNLQMISSLLYFQAQNAEDVRLVNVLQESRNRIKSIAIVHEQLYQTKDLAKIEFDSYLRSLTSYLFHVYTVNTETIALQIAAEKIILTVETAIPCALALNELVTNVLKHAFPNDRSGKLRIDFHQEKNQGLLRISDDGIGMPHALDLHHIESLGLSLVMDLVIKQLHGQVELDRTQGTTFTITFPIPYET
jgi:two-component sensor histidine kinase